MIDSTTSPKVKKTTKGKGIGVHSLTHITLGVKGHVEASRWGLGRMTSGLIIHTNQTTSWLMCSWSTFGAQTNHGHTQTPKTSKTSKTHKTHHDLNLEEATTFPLIALFMISHRGYIQMSFCLGTPKFSKLGLLWFGGP